MRPPPSFLFHAAGVSAGATAARRRRTTSGTCGTKAAPWAGTCSGLVRPLSWRNGSEFRLAGFQRLSRQDRPCLRRNPRPCPVRCPCQSHCPDQQLASMQQLSSSRQRPASGRDPPSLRTGTARTACHHRTGPSRKIGVAKIAGFGPQNLSNVHFR